MFRKNTKNIRLSNILIFIYLGIALFSFGACGSTSSDSGDSGGGTKQYTSNQAVKHTIDKKTYDIKSGTNESARTGTIISGENSATITNNGEITQSDNYSPVSSNSLKSLAPLSLGQNSLKSSNIIEEKVFYALKVKNKSKSINNHSITATGVDFIPHSMDEKSSLIAMSANYNSSAVNEKGGIINFSSSLSNTANLEESVTNPPLYYGDYDNCFEVFPMQMYANNESNITNNGNIISSAQFSSAMFARNSSHAINKGTIKVINSNPFNKNLFYEDKYMNFMHTFMYAEHNSTLVNNGTFDLSSSNDLNKNYSNLTYFMFATDDSNLTNNEPINIIEFDKFGGQTLRVLSVKSSSNIINTQSITATNMNYANELTLLYEDHNSTILNEKLGTLKITNSQSSRMYAIFSSEDNNFINTCNIHLEANTVTATSKVTGIMNAISLINDKKAKNTGTITMINNTFNTNNGYLIVEAINVVGSILTNTRDITMNQFYIKNQGYPISPTIIELSDASTLINSAILSIDAKNSIGVKIGENSKLDNSGIIEITSNSNSSCGISIEKSDLKETDLKNYITNIGTVIVNGKHYKDSTSAWNASFDSSGKAKTGSVPICSSGGSF